MSKSLKIIAGAVCLCLLFLAFCFRAVGAGETAVITRFGEVEREVNSGIVLKLPWPIEKMYKMDTRVQKEEQDVAAATVDLQDVNAKVALNYALDRGNAVRMFKEVGMDYKERIILPKLQEAFKAATAQYPANELLSKRPEVKQKVLAEIRVRLEPLGIRVDDLNIVNFNFSDEFNKAIEAKQVAAQQAEQAKYEVEKQKNLAQAGIEGAKGVAESNRLIRESLTPELVQKMAVEKWDGKLPVYSGGNGLFFNLPVNK